MLPLLLLLLFLQYTPNHTSYIVLFKYSGGGQLNLPASLKSLLAPKQQQQQQQQQQQCPPLDSTPPNNETTQVIRRIHIHIDVHVIHIDVHIHCTYCIGHTVDRTPN